MFGGHPARSLFKASHAQCLCFCPSGFWQKWHLVASSPSWCLRLSSVKKVSIETLAKDTCLLRVCGQTVYGKFWVKCLLKSRP